MTRRVGSSVLLASIRRRPAAFLGLVALSAGVVLSAVLPPLLLRATQQDALTAATSPGTTAVVVHGSGQLFSATGSPQVRRAIASLTTHPSWSVRATIAVALQPALVRRAPADAGTYRHVVAEAGCGDVRITEGRCPTAADELALPAGGLGDVLIGPSRTVQHVVGRYAPGPDGFPFQHRALAAAAGAIPAGAMLVDPSWFAAVGADGVGGTIVQWTRPLRLDDGAAVRMQIASARRLLGTDSGAYLAAPAIAALDGVERSGADDLVVLGTLGVQLLAVAWAAEALVVLRGARARSREWGLARLRGFSRGRRLLLVFLEPLIAVGVGAPLGWLAGAATAQALSAWIGGGAVVEPARWEVLAAAAAAVMGSLVALVLASIRGATVPLPALLRETVEPRRVGRASLAAQAAVVLATALVLAALVTGGPVSGLQLPLLLPALLALTVGLLAARAGVILLRLGSRGEPRRVGGLILARQAARTPSVFGVAVVMTVAVAVCAYAIQTDRTVARLQALRADATVGAQRVLGVRVPPGFDLMRAVAHADPSGRRAMAVEELSAGGGAQHIVAVDTARLAAVSTWSTAWAGQAADRLRTLLAPAHGPSLVLHGAVVHLRTSEVGPLAIPGVRGPTAGPADIEVALVLQSAGAWSTVSLGRMTGDLRAAIPCTTGCRVVALTFVSRNPAPLPYSGSLVLDGLETDRQPAAALAAWSEPGRWRQRIDAGASLTDRADVALARVGAGLSIRVASRESTAVTAIATRDAPQALPVLLGPSSGVRSAPGLPGTVLGVGLAVEPLLLHPVGRATVLPRALGQGVLADLGVLRSLSDASVKRSRSEVWLTGQGAQGVVRALREQGVTIESDQQRTDVERALDAAPLPRVAALGAVVGGAGVLLALLAIGALVAADAVERRRLTDVLALSGVPRRRIRRLVAAQALWLPAIGTLAGAPAGVLAAVLIAGVLPLRPASVVVPPLDQPLSLQAFLLPLAVAALLLVLVGAVLDRVSGPDRRPA